MATFYFDRYGIETVSIRIGLFPSRKPPDDEHLAELC